MDTESTQQHPEVVLEKEPVAVNVEEVSSASSPEDIETMRRRKKNPITIPRQPPNGIVYPMPGEGPGHPVTIPRNPDDRMIYPMPGETPQPGFHLRPSSPTGSLRSSYGGHTRRRVVRRSYSGHHSHGGHHSEVSKELTLAAETEFLALTELMTSMTRRSSSLKEVWLKLINERESHCTEIDSLYLRIEEYIETIEEYKRESHGHNHDHEERKKELLKLRLELSAALTAVVEWKRKFEDRSGDLGKAHSRISELEDLLKYSTENYEKSERSVEQKTIEIIAIRERCESAEEDARKHENELEALKVRYKKIETNFTELSSKYKSSQLDIATLKAQNETYIKERHEWMLEKGELEDKLRKRELDIVTLRSDIDEVNTSLTKKKRELAESEEVNKTLNESLKKSKTLIEEQEESISKKKREYSELLVRFGNMENTCATLKTKCLHYEEQLTTLKSTVSRLEIERTTLTESLTELRTKYSELEITYGELQREHHGKCKESEDRHRLILVHEQTIIRNEHSIKEKTELIHTHRETIERITTDYEDYKNRCEDYVLELATSVAAVAALKLEIDVLKKERDSWCERYTDCESKYTEICLWRDEFHGGNSELDYEISSLRGMLKDVREERERAIKKREEADRERDEATMKYESKCREMDKLEEKWSRRWREHGGHGGHHGGHVGIGGPGYTVGRPYDPPVRIFSETAGSVRDMEEENGSVVNGGGVAMST